MPALSNWGLKTVGWDYVIALAGNPNNWKSTALMPSQACANTRQLAGKTIARAEGGFSRYNARYKLVDLSHLFLLSTSTDEEVARDFSLRVPDVAVIVLDATAVERNLNLALQVLQIAPRAVVALNLTDELSITALRSTPKHRHASWCSSRTNGGTKW